MSLTERKIIDKIEVLDNNFIQIREANIIEKNGVEITRTFHRFILHPGDDLTEQEPKVVAIANAIWTQEVIDAYQEKLKNLHTTYL